MTESMTLYKGHSSCVQYNFPKFQFETLSKERMKVMGLIWETYST